MIDIYSGEIKDIIPVNLLNPEVEAISFAVGQALKKLQDFAMSSSLYVEINKVPEYVLDLMALELNTQYYEQSLPRSMKEALIGQTIPWYMHAGTVPVLEEFLKTVLDGGIITEWFQYGGEPYHFKALVSVGENEIPLGYGKKVSQQICIYKNLRSHLEALIFNYRTGYEVPIRYDNLICFQMSFHPRYNLPYLLMDGTWKMDGSRRMSGYDSTDVLDFYPVALRMKTEVTECICLESHIQLSHKLELDVGAENAIEVRAEVQSEAAAETEARYRNETRLNMETKTMLQIVQETKVELTAGSMLHLHTGAGKTIQTKEHIRVCAGAEYQLETASYMTKQNLMDGTWKMDGSRKMDGGLYVL